MSIDIRARIRKKSTLPKTTLTLEDVNRDMIVSLLSVDIYGAEAREEDILELIIGGGIVMDSADCRKKMREDFEKIKKTLKRGKDGLWHDKDGFIVLEPA